MGDVTLEQVKNVCGEYTSKNGPNYNFQCPICMDNHKDNLVFNEYRQIIKCFANYDHTLQVLKMINDKKPKQQITERKLYKTQVNAWEERQQQYLEYMTLAQDVLLNDNDLLKYIYDKRKITKQTLELCSVGFDNTENWFMIPIFSLRYDGLITDFELRMKSEQKQIKRIGGGCNTIAQIYGSKQNETLIVVEGFIDGITLVQWMLEKNQKDFTVYSCSNGVSSLINILNEISFNNFKNIKLILDNDEAGDKVTAQIIEKYPFIKDSRQFLVDSNCKDINEFYKKKVRV